MRLEPAVTRAAGVCVLLATSACGGEPRGRLLPTTPTAAPVPVGELPALPTRTVTGTAWLYSPTGRQPLAGINVAIALERPFSAGPGGSVPRVTTSSDGRFSFDVVSDALVRLYVRTAELLQPCQATAGVGQTETVIRMVAESDVLRAREWPDFAVERTLSGTVFEASPTGRQPSADAWVQVDGVMGDGKPLADTRTDANGRFVLCGLEGETQIPHAVVVAKPGFQIGVASIPAHGGGPLDVELRACPSNSPRLGGGWCH